VRSAEGRNFSASGTRLYASWSTVEASVIVVDNRPVDHHRAVVDVGNVDAADVVDRAVIAELIVIPVAALVACSNIAKAIVDSAIEANITAPVAAIEAIASIDEAPISRRPQRALVGRLGPGSGNPVIAGRGPAPVAGRP
jgi:hypothetical protein